VAEVFRKGALKCTATLKEDEGLCVLCFEAVVSRTSSMKQIINGFIIKSKKKKNNRFLVKYK
jgi:hypothetical protein